MISPRFARRWLSLLVPCALFVGTYSSPAQSPGKRETSKPAPSAKPAAAAKPGATPTPAPYVLPETLATVDGEPIKKQEVERLALALAGNNGRTLQDLPPSEKRQAYQSVVDSIVVDKIASKAAAGEQVNDIDVEKRYGELMAQYPNPQEFDKQVKQSGQTTDGLKKNIRSQLAQQQWLEKQIAPDIKVTPEEVEKFYKESPPNKLDVPEMVRASHILVKASKTAPPEDSLLAEQKAVKLAAHLQAGEKFEDVAKSNSDDASAKKNGGDLGWFARDHIMPEFGDVAFKLKIGEISPPVRTQFGYHLIKVLDHKPAHTATLDEARDQISGFLQAEKRQKAVAGVVQGLRDNARVEVFLP